MQNVGFAKSVQFTVTGNDDPWGLILYGTVETLRSVRDRISSPAVIVFTPVPLQYFPTH